MKNYLEFENQRNKESAAIFERFLRAAIHDKLAVLVGHHITFEIDGNLNSENEIPSADCLLFDHELMEMVFGDHALELMLKFVVAPCESRDQLLKSAMDEHGVPK